MIRLPWLAPDDEDTPLPPPEYALREPDGLLAGGGSLSPKRLIDAYRCGIFPWYSAGQPILWWSPDPRAVLLPTHLKVSRSLRKRIRQARYTITYDQAFPAVVAACAAPRRGADGTWITQQMQRAYLHLHELGVAHSAEAWLNGVLVGGLYGVALGRVFFGESMFSRATDASKVAFVQLVQHLADHGYMLIDCQVHSEHLASLGAEDIPRREFIDLLKHWCDAPPLPGAWSTGTGDEGC